MIDVRDVAAGYDGKPILTNISFSLPKGRIMGLLGRNGCGKTTLFRCMNGLLKPISGMIRLNDRDISKLSQREIARTAALVPQATAAAFSISVKDMILLGASCRIKAWQAPDKPLEEEAAAHAAEIGILKLIDKQFNELSGGEQQLVLIARALMQNTEILFLDEPTSHLDFTNRYMVMDMVSKLAIEKDMTVVITAPDPNMVLEYCTDVFMIKEGSTLALGTIDDIRTEKNLQELYGECITLKETDFGKVVVPSKRRS